VSYDLANLEPLVQQLVFGRTDPSAEAAGGIMAACSLTETQVVAEADIGERPKGLFLTFAMIEAGGHALRGHPDNPYTRVEEDPDDEHGCLLIYEKVATHTLRLSLRAPARTHTAEAISYLAKLAVRHLESEAPEELSLLGMDALIVDPGVIRDASTVLNRSVERVVRFETRLHVGESWSVPRATFEKVAYTLQEGKDEGTQESKEIQL